MPLSWLLFAPAIHGSPFGSKAESKKSNICFIFVILIVILKFKKINKQLSDLCWIFKLSLPLFRHNGIQYEKGRAKWTRCSCRACSYKCIVVHLASKATEENRRFFEALCPQADDMT